MSNTEVDYPSLPDGKSLKLDPNPIQGSARDVPLVFVGDSTSTKPPFLTKLNSQILSISVSYSISAATAVTFSVIDPGLELTLQNYFQVGQTLVYRSHKTYDIKSGSGVSNGGFSTDAAAEVNNKYMAYFLEIADVTVEQSEGASPTVRVQCYTKAIQQMKRDKNPGVVQGTGSDFVRNAAKKYGLGCIAQQTSTSRQITQASGDNVADSLWTVLERLAGESKDENKNPFVLFESDGTLYFGTQQWLMYKWGHDAYKHSYYDKKAKANKEVTRYVTYLHYPSKTINGAIDQRFKLLGLPSMHKAENDPMEGDGSCIVERTNGVRLRPGMTVNVGDIPWFTDDFLITEVDYEELVADPVNVRFATPPRQEKKIKQIAIGQIYPGSVDWLTITNLLGDQTNKNYKGKS